jgi:transposase
VPTASSFCSGIPAQYRVLVTRRPKYACRACANAIVQAPAPERLIKGGLPTEAMVAHVLASKYAWHLPLYRQAQMLKSQGIVVERVTLASWVGYAAAELAPVVARLREILLGSVKLAVDETPMPVLDPGRGRTKIGYFWSMARDDRPWGNDDPPAVAYTYAPGRGAEHAIKLLAGYSGIVQCDGYAAYKQLADGRRSSGPATLAFCWAHWRRRFYEIAKAGPAPIAQEALTRIAALYAIEKRIRGHSAANAWRCVKQRVSAHRCSKILARKRTQARVRQIGHCRRDPLRPQALGRSGALPRRWPHRDGHQCRRARNPAGHCSPAATKAPPTGLPSPR